MSLDLLWTWGFWLLVPVFLWNLLLAHRLPRAYQAPAWDQIPRTLGLVENLLRFLVFLPLALVQIDPGRLGGPGLTYLLGLGLYFFSWVLVIRGSRWSTRPLGFSAPAWTSGTWLISAFLLCPRTLWGWEVPWFIPLVLVLGFTLVHTLHALRVFGRENL